MCRVQGIGPDLSFSAQPDSTMEIYLCTPWQYCRIYGLDLLTFSTVTGMRVGRQASARRVQAPLYFIEIYIYIYIYIYTSSCIPTLCEGCCTSIQLPLEQSCLTSPRRTCPRCLHNGQLNGDRASICFHRAFGAGGWKEAHPSGWVNQPGDYLHLLTFSARTPTRLSSG